MGLLTINEECAGAAEDADIYQKYSLWPPRPLRRVVVTTCQLSVSNRRFPQPRQIWLTSGDDWRHEKLWQVVRMELAHPCG